MRNNNLDERQEQILLKIEHNGCWFAYWGLLAVIAVETFIFDLEMKAVMGEWIIFMALSMYIFADCMKKGIWDRKLKPNFRTNALVSAVASLVFGILMAISIYKRSSGNLLDGIIAGAVSAIFIFVVLLVALSFSAKRVKKIAAKQEAETEEQK